MKIKIRKATKKDFEKYYPLKLEESKEYEKIIGKIMKIPSKQSLKKEFLNFVSKKNSFILFAGEEGNFVAYINVSIYKNIWSQCGYIEDIFVLKDYRNKGFATKLIKKFVSFLKKNNIHELELSVNVKNKNAIKLYNKLGFEINKYENG